MQAWAVIDRVTAPDGVLELRRRGDDDFLITLDGRVLMNSRAQRSERALAQLACGALGDRADVRVLVGGLGMGITLQAALAALPPSARVVVAELNACVAAWCRGPLAELNDDAVADARVSVAIEDVADSVARAARDRVPYDAILLDLYEGPRTGRAAARDPHFGAAALAAARAALAPGGVLAVWAEAPDPAFAARLAKAGFAVSKRRPGRGGLRHVVYLAIRPA